MQWEVPKYGLTVSGLVHPDKIITNADTKAGDILILTKPIGAGIILSGKKIGEASQEDYQASFRNQEFVEEFCHFDKDLSYEQKMIIHDAQTSGGLLMCVSADQADEVLNKLQKFVYPLAAIIGKVKAKAESFIEVN